MYGYESWTIKKVEQQRTDAFKLQCWRRLLRVTWTAKRSNQSILKEINPEYSLEGLMLKLKLQYFGHLMQRANSLGKTLMLGKIEGRRRGLQRMRWLDGITDSMDMSLSKLRRQWRTASLACCSPWGHKELDTTEWLNNNEFRRKLCHYRSECCTKGVKVRKANMRKIFCDPRTRLRDEENGAQVTTITAQDKTEFQVEERRGTPRQNIQNKICVTRPPYLPPFLATVPTVPKLPRISSQKGFLPTNTTCHPWRPTSRAFPSLRPVPPWPQWSAPCPALQLPLPESTAAIIRIFTATPVPSPSWSRASVLPKPWAPFCLRHK